MAVRVLEDLRICREERDILKQKLHILLDHRTLDKIMFEQSAAKVCREHSFCALYLTLEAAGVRNTAADHAASHIGKGEGLGLLLQATPVHGARRRTYIAIEIAAKVESPVIFKYGLSQEDICRGQNAEALADAVHEVASVANAHLEKAHALSSSVSKEADVVLLLSVPASLLLQSLERCNFNVFDPKLTRRVCGISPLWMQLQLKWHAFRGTY